MVCVYSSFVTVPCQPKRLVISTVVSTDSRASRVQVQGKRLDPHHLIPNLRLDHAQWLPAR